MDGARRLALGQWFTPPEVADLTLSLAVPAGACAGALRVLDPACGDGVFLARARARGLGASGGALCGVEIEEAAAAAARASVPEAELHRGDLFALEPAALGEDFDVVVGNPPYVRQERLTRGQKLRVRARLASDFPTLPATLLDQVVRRGDLAAACLLRALRLTRPGGRMALVVSSALLDAGYAAALWDAIARCGRVHAIVDAPGERWFAEAAVNAVIVVVERAPSASPGRAVRLARLSVPTREAARRVRSSEDLGAVAELRQAPAEAPRQWATGLRASAAWFDFVQAAGDALVPLERLATVRRGVTSGANEVFYLPRAHARALALEPAALLPLLRSPRAHAAIAVVPQESSHVALVCPPESEPERAYPHTWRYLQAHREVAARPSLRARKPWWALPVRPARLFLAKAYAARFAQPLASADMVADQRVYSIHPRAPSAPLSEFGGRACELELLAAILNSAFTAFAIESLGRASMGEGALEWTVSDAAQLPVLDPRRLTPAQAEAVRAALVALSARPIGDVASERERRDRAQLDAQIAALVPGLNELLARIWDALTNSVAARHARARATAVEPATESASETPALSDSAG
ncbi:N-6 DNA methylase [Haliangium ochraceum]|uniref:N-6 DNA methylase n=1 Tax=Haliangium ochraceum (strain DSM 14365 / JCM 11303 / SMP-2) TaxID=502025 RepID=D0LKG8_HALO1|nr:class I SAM-dependent methyltransferase [Haliangium ochraceum]ACY15016.1 N-6 DNA methylase [Haliangium ochraceum DSM 14365]